MPQIPDKHWMVPPGVRLQPLLNDAKDSPVTSQRGNSTPGYSALAYPVCSNYSQGLETIIMKNKFIKFAAIVTILPATALILTGCWTPPNANVQPSGEPRLIQGGISVESVKDPATVQALDSAQGTITLALPSGGTATYKVGPKVKHFDRVQAGDQVEATVTDELAVYLLADGKLPDGSTAESLGVNARVQQVDPSYRLLTLQYPNGQTDIVKPPVGTLMLQMTPGDSVVVRPGELKAISIEKK